MAKLLIQRFDNLSIIVILWIFLGILCFGAIGTSFILTRKSASKTWTIKIDNNYSPSISILVPTYNESNAIRLKLENLNKLDYPRDLMQILIVDSNSTDGTIEIVNEFIKNNKDLPIKIFAEKQRKGKSAALNSVLQYINSEVIVISDADCFYKPDVLRKSLPYLADQKVAAISGPKFLISDHPSKTILNEMKYLNSANFTKLGESKMGFTPLFEGGFSAYKKTALTSFDSFQTGSDDCGTVISLAEKSSSALFIPEAAFYTTFPQTWKGRFDIKTRRANQIIRVFWKYLTLLISGKIVSFKKVLIVDTLIYLFSPVFFVVFLGLTISMFLMYPLSSLLLLLLVLPKIGPLLIELSQSYLILFTSIIAVLFKKNFIIWKQPEDRRLITEELLKKSNLL
jgi:poly-beta-1,6-N-acetyl-D-glucosamine synthase